MDKSRKRELSLKAEEDARKDFEQFKLDNVKRCLSWINECSRWLAEETEFEVRSAIQNLMLILSKKCSAEISRVVIPETTDEK